MRAQRKARPTQHSPAEDAAGGSAVAELDVLAVSAGFAPPPHPYAAPTAETRSNAKPPTEELFMMATTVSALMASR